MKKKVLIVLLGSLMFVACSGKESLIKGYEKACEKGDIEKAEKIATKIDKKYGDDITLKEAARIAKASMKLYGKSLDGFMDEYNETMKDVMDEYKNTMDDVMDEYKNTMDDVMKSF